MSENPHSRSNSDPTPGHSRTFEKPTRLDDVIGPDDKDLAEAVYTQLRALAHKHLHAERPGHTLSATALVHEAFVRLAAPRDVPFANRGHYYTAAALAMRRILIDHARAKTAHRRGGPDAKRAALDLAALPDPNSEKECAGFLILDETISRLEGADPQAAAVVRLRYFGGLSVADTAATLGVSEPTVKRAWAFARAWLTKALQTEPD